MALTEKQKQQTAARQQRFRERQAEARRLEQDSKGLPPVPVIPSMPGTARWKGLLDAARLNLETARYEMQAYYEDRSEEWQEGQKGQSMQERLDEIEAAIDALPVE